jgi:Tfp pilus assembly protein PilF
MGLGYLGKGDTDSAKAQFTRATEEDINHIWAAALLLNLK